MRRGALAGVLPGILIVAMGGLAILPAWNEPEASQSLIPDSRALSYSFLTPLANGACVDAPLFDPPDALPRDIQRVRCSSPEAASRVRSTRLKSDDAADCRKDSYYTIPWSDRNVTERDEVSCLETILEAGLCAPAIVTLDGLIRPDFAYTQTCAARPFRPRMNPEQRLVGAFYIRQVIITGFDRCNGNERLRRLTTTHTTVCYQLL